MINTKGIALLSAAALLAPALATAAENMPWTYIEAGYLPKVGIDFGDDDDFTIDAGQLTGSIGFLGMGHAQIEYTNGDAAETDFDGYRLVVGGHNQLGENTQLIGDLTYFDYSYDGGEGCTFFNCSNEDIDTDGFGVGLGLRHAINSRVEVSSQLWYLDGNVDQGNDDADFNSTILELRARYNWTKQISTGVTAYIGGAFFGAGSSGASFLDTGDFYRLDARWAFGNSDFSDLK
jgi:hypothetical protein